MDIDSGFNCLALTEKQPRLAFGVVPVCKQASRCFRYAGVTVFAPDVDFFPHAVDKRVGLSEFGHVQFKLRLNLFRLLPRFRHRNEVFAFASSVDDVCGDTAFIEFEVALRFVKRAVDDRVFYGNFRHVEFLHS